MSSGSSHASPSPALFFDTINAHQKSAALKGAIELDLFTAIADGHDTARKLAHHCKCNERGVRILADYLVVLGFLTKHDHHYSLTQDSTVFLNRHSPAYAGGAIKFLLHPHMMTGFENIAETVRQGRTQMHGQGTTAPEAQVWVHFARAMAPLMRMPAKLLAELILGDALHPMKILDVAAGHGVYGISFAQKNPNLHLTALDWAPVLEVARENARSAGIEQRFATRPGSAFEIDLGEGYDLILLPNFLHHFDEPTCTNFLRRTKESLAPGGKVVTFEFIPDEDRVAPPTNATFAFTMLATTPAGDAYTFKEYERMFANAGFSKSELHPLPSVPQRVVISWP